MKRLRRVSDIEVCPDTGSVVSVSCGEESFPCDAVVSAVGINGVKGIVRAAPALSKFPFFSKMMNLRWVKIHNGLGLTSQFHNHRSWEFELQPRISKTRPSASWRSEAYLLLRLLRGNQPKSCFHTAVIAYFVFGLPLRGGVLVLYPYVALERRVVIPVCLLPRRD